MLSTRQMAYLAPAVSDRLVIFNNTLDLAPYCVVENLDDTTSSSIKYQESDDGSSWADIAGTPATVNPGESNGQIVVSARRLIALFAGGNVDVLVSVVRQVNGAPLNLGVA